MLSHASHISGANGHMWANGCNGIDTTHFHHWTALDMYIYYIRENKAIAAKGKIITGNDYLKNCDTYLP